ncbi:MAG: hypothetical protein QHJ74_14185, partial [Anaerolineae bacterium]|nr:hypothetical protein [Anaerolineae bacterium]
MHHFTAHQLHFTCAVQTPILLNEHQGSAIRGALFNALRRHFCFEKQLQDCGDCPLWTTCPICFLVATRNPQSERGVEVPRPYTIEPPLHPIRNTQYVTRLTPHASPGVRYEPGETFSFGLTMFARALNLFPYVVLASQELERGGLGKRVGESASQQISKSANQQIGKSANQQIGKSANQQIGKSANRQSPIPRRGTFVIREIAAVNPLTGGRQPVLRAGDKMVQVPDIPITHQQICEWANQQISESAKQQVVIQFLTPTRITEEKRLLKPQNFQFRPFFQRLLERLEALSRDFSDTPQQFDFPALLAAAEKVRVMKNNL